MRLMQVKESQWAIQPHWPTSQQFAGQVFTSFDSWAGVKTLRYGSLHKVGSQAYLVSALEERFDKRAFQLGLLITFAADEGSAAVALDAGNARIVQQSNKEGVIEVFLETFPSNKGPVATFWRTTRNIPVVGEPWGRIDVFWKQPLQQKPGLHLEYY